MPSSQVGSPGRRRGSPSGNKVPLGLGQGARPGAVSSVRCARSGNAGGSCTGTKGLSTGSGRSRSLRLPPPAQPNPPPEADDRWDPGAVTRRERSPGARARPANSLGRAALRAGRLGLAEGGAAGSTAASEGSRVSPAAASVPFLGAEWGGKGGGWLRSRGSALTSPTFPALRPTGPAGPCTLASAAAPSFALLRISCQRLRVFLVLSLLTSIFLSFH